ncbi:MAG: MarR family transcriptional regulator [Phycisphaeraceae bacterium]|nr:MAG: MarR family transcriptional regulator [Phycisphaeraceae bacterium]
MAAESGPTPHADLAGRVGKRQPFASPEQETYLNLVRTHARLAAPFHKLFRTRGISPALYNILRILRGHMRHDEGAGNTHFGVPVLRIGQEMVTREPDMTRLIARLAAGQLVTRARCEEDRRIVYVRITPRGLSLLEVIEPEIDALHRSQFGRLSREELGMLNRLLFLASGDADS